MLYQNQDFDAMQLITELRFAKRINDDYFSDSLVKTEIIKNEVNFIPSEDDEL